MPALLASEKINSTLAAAIAHPLRARCLMFLSMRVASPAEMGTAFGEEVSRVNYHVHKLEEANLIELVDEKPVRGAVEHFYRAIERPMVTEEQYALLDQGERNGFAIEILQRAIAEAAAALATQTFSSRPDNCVCSTPMVLDEQGWKDVYRLHEQTVLKSMDIEAESNARRVESGETGTTASSLVVFYETDRLTY